MDGFTKLPDRIASALKGDAYYTIEASCKGADGIENGITFGSFPQFMLIEIHGQDIVSAVAVIFHIHTT